MIFIGGPCVVESTHICEQVAYGILGALPEGVDYIFKASWDKANRTSHKSFRGVSSGPLTLYGVRDQGFTITTDFHTNSDILLHGPCADIIQIPALLCRQTDLLKTAGLTGKIVNIKKGQFMAPWDMKYAVEKARHYGAKEVWVTERGSSFGYNNLVVDFRSLSIMKGFADKVIFDATHSVQLPGGNGVCSGGQREFVLPLARAAVAFGVDGVFMEVHPDPDHALCDGPNSVHLRDIGKILRELVAIERTRDTFMLDAAA